MSRSKGSKRLPLRTPQKSLSVRLPAKMKKPVRLSAKMKKPMRLPAKTKKPVRLPAKTKKPVRLPAKTKKPVRLPAKMKKPRRGMWLSTPVRPHHMPVYDGPYDPSIAALVEADNRELVNRVLLSPNYAGLENPSDELLKSKCWKMFLDDERMVQVRELKTEVAILQEELKSAVRFIDPKKMFKKRILRLFPGHGIFEGTVTSWKKPYFKIKYDEDNDREELDAMEVIKMLIN